jgi:zinc protease
MDHSSKTGFELQVERFVLPNGLVLLLSENRSTPAVSISALVQTGSRYESDQKAGLASMVGELLDEGTTSRTSKQIAETIESVGARMATYGDYQSSGVALLMLSKDAGLGLEISADLLINSVFPQDKLELQIERRKAQIKSRLDMPRTQASDKFNEIVFEGTPQHRPTIGYEETINGLNRDDMLQFYSRHFSPGNTVLAIVGDIDRTFIRESAEELFGGWRIPSGYSVPAVAKPQLSRLPIDCFVQAPKEQVNIFMGHVGIERTNRDYHSLLVLDTILGSSPGFTSRIPRILRDEQGLAYSTYANITSSAGVDPGRFVAYIGTSPDNLDRALDGLRTEITRIVEGGVTEEELKVAKAYLTGSFVFKLQKNSQVAEFVTEAEIYGLGFDYPQRFPGMILDVTVDAVTRAARTYLHPDRLTTVVVGPVKSEAAASSS